MQELGYDEVSATATDVDHCTQHLHSETLSDGTIVVDCGDGGLWHTRVEGEDLLVEPPQLTSEAAQHRSGLVGILEMGEGLGCSGVVLVIPRNLADQNVLRALGYLGFYLVRSPAGCADVRMRTEL